MIIRFLISSLVLFFSGSSLLNANNPHAFIMTWTQASYGNVRGCADGQPSLPIYVKIDFNQPTTQIFADQFFRFLAASISPSNRMDITASKHKLGGFCMRVRPSMSKELFQDLIDKANHHFDSDFKTAQEIEVFKKQLIEEKTPLSTTLPRVYISEVVNKTNKPLSLVYPFLLDTLKIGICKSIETGIGCNIERLVENINNMTRIIIPSQTIVSLEGAYIPFSDITYEKTTGIYVGFGIDAISINNNGSGNRNFAFALITEKSDQGGQSIIQSIPIEEDKLSHQMTLKKQGRLAVNQENLDENAKLVLEVTLPNILDIHPRADKIIEHYTNPRGLLPQALLHQAIVKNSKFGVKDAIQEGADPNIGIAKQPPLLLAILNGSYEAAKGLLESGANPNIIYEGHSLALRLEAWRDLALIDLFFDHGLILSKNDREKAINKWLSEGQGYQEGITQIFKKLGPDIEKNVKDPNVTKNNWYGVLDQFFTKKLYNRDIALIKLYIQYGANPNQVFELPNREKRVPLLLIIDNFIEAVRSTADLQQLQIATESLLRVFAGAGADFDQYVTMENTFENPLSLMLKKYSKTISKYDHLQFDIINYLITCGARLSNALKLFLKNGGSPDKQIFRKTLIEFAVQKGDPESVEILINAGAQWSDSLLRQAIEAGNEKIINLLIKSKG